MTVDGTRWFRCLGCQARHDIGPLFRGCPACAGVGVFGPLDVEYDYESLGRRLTLSELVVPPKSIWSAHPLLPLAERRHVVSLGEGQTPLVRISRLGRELGCPELYLKNETTNPTWSHKDRYNSVVVSMARRFGIERILTYTTGNHGNSLAAYAAAGELRSAVFLHPRSSPVQKGLGRVYGGEVIVGDKAVVEATMARMIQDHGWVPSASFSYRAGGHAEHFVNPFGPEGYKTIAYELAAELGPTPPEYVLAPVGYGDLLSGIWKGYRELLAMRLIPTAPRMVGCQTDSGDPLTQAVRGGAAEIRAVEERDGLPLSIIEGRCGDLVLQAVRDSRGLAESVSDDEVEEAMRRLGRAGLCVEPASAVPLAVLPRLVRSGAIERRARIVCIITSAGVKWPDELARVVGVPPAVTAGTDPALARLTS